MRAAYALVVAAGCGFGVPAGVAPGDDVLDAPPGDAFVHEVEPRLIAGGGIGDAPLGSVVHVYVIDAVLRTPIAGVHVEVGGVGGTTDSTGLFTARAEALQGKQRVLATMAGYRAEVWLGVAGANVTLPLVPVVTPAVPRADLSGNFTGFNTGLPALAMSHVRGGRVSYSDLDSVPEAWNNLRTANGADSCRGGMCDFTITTRTGKVALFAATYDIDTKGTPELNDDTSVFQTYNYRTGITVVDGMMQGGRNLTQVDPTTLVNATLDFGTPPPNFGTVVGVIGIELPTDGVVFLNGLLDRNAAVTKSPPLTLFPGATYRAIGFAAEGGALCIVVKRAGLSLGTWLTAPAVAAATRSEVSWTPPAGATYSGALIRDAAGTQIAEILAFDRATTTAALPAAIVLPASSLTVQAIAYRTSWDVASFSFAADAAKADASSSSATTAVP